MPKFDLHPDGCPDCVTLQHYIDSASGTSCALAGVHPFNAESPWRAALLPIIPSELHYVRNHGGVPQLDWASHKVSVQGLVDQPKSFTMAELAKFPKHSVTVTLVCSGNR